MLRDKTFGQKAQLVFRNLAFDNMSTKSNSQDAFNLFKVVKRTAHNP